MLQSLTRSRSSGVALGLTVFLLVAPLACAGSSDDGEPAAAQLEALTDEVWRRTIERAPLLRLREGLPVNEIPPISYERAREDADFAQSVLDRVAAIDRAALTHDEVLTAEILEWQSGMAVEGLQFYWLNSLLTPYRNPLPGLKQIFVGLPLDDLQDLEDYLGLLEQVAAYVDALHETVRGQAERGFVISAQNMPAVIAVTRAQIQPPELHPLAVADGKLDGFATEDSEAFLQQFGEIVDTAINPALELLVAYLEGAYSEQAPEAVGVRQYPNGEAFYRYLVRLNTTLDITPEEVHAIGLEMVAEMQERMASIQGDTDFAGDRAEFHQHLRTEPRFYPDTPDEVAEAIQSAADAFYARVDEFFLVKPAEPFGVRRLDPALEGSQTYGYYSPPTPTDPKGYYNFNGSNLHERSSINLAGLAFHELFPGHHFHIARQYANEELPAFRRYSTQTAFTEGWGSYSTYLGEEAGMYEDPYSHYGMYALEIFLATRLVVDPGMNYLGWTLGQARDFMSEATLESATQIATESLRYSTDMPGQALGYQMGKRKFLELRKRAEDELGERFDIRRFHEAIMGPGSMPMAVLERHIDWFIEQEKGGS